MRGMCLDVPGQGNVIQRTSKRQLHTYTHAHVAPAITRMCTHIELCVCAGVHVPACTPAHAQINTKACARTQERTHPNICMHMHAHRPHAHAHKTMHTHTAFLAPGTEHSHRDHTTRTAHITTHEACARTQVQDRRGRA